MGGLTAARVLASRFERVTVLERDELPDDGQERRGVPQAGHAHALLTKGRLELEALFPGFTRDLLAGGAVRFDAGRDTLFYQLGRPRVRFFSDHPLITMSRPFLERTLRGRVRALPGVEIRERTAVAGLTGDAGRVTGVLTARGETVDADLVVDATGHSTHRTDRWLQALGCPPPQVSSVRIDVGYTTRLYWRTDAMERLADGAFAYASTGMPPHDKRAAAVAPIEDGRWIVTLGGWHRANAPADVAGFADFAARLPSPHIARLLSTAEPVHDGTARRYSAPTARRRHFERLGAPPAGYAALGDAVCTFNPLYGQGMTLAILQAVELGRCLDRHGTAEEMTREHFRNVARIVDLPWRMSTESDLMFPETVGHRPRGLAARAWYTRQVLLASHVSERVHRDLLRVTSLVAAPSALFDPLGVLRILWAARRSPARRAGFDAREVRV
ncbi:NAD(P)/FAD-dependent oxidoreductase [Streptomyces sp. NPDC018693]|uniref:NAD(P)/FAD-dependent oxidoreductase n=1 Tax=unclassified Streptomyces TaxID=2593676 RepID=UPI0037A3D494